ncbi:MAG: hypothetical protein SFW64_00285 [Alphaproteobacteria bacterium]|nr:hypothetical protein [Alphaproteobacteria bacterium]
MKKLYETLKPSIFLTCAFLAIYIAAFAAGKGWRGGYGQHRQILHIVMHSGETK